MLNFLNALAAASLGGSAAILLLTALSPFLARRFTPAVRRSAWNALAHVLFLIPFLSMPVISDPIPHAVRLDIPQVLVDSEYRFENDYLTDNAYAQIHYDSGNDGFTGGRHYLHYRGENGRELVIEDNLFQRTVTEDDVQTQTVHWTTLLFLGWLMGAAVHIAAVWGNYIRFRRRAMLWAIPAGKGVLAALDAQRAAVGCVRTPELYRCPLIRTPLLMGIWRPVILLPEKMPENAMNPALAHELTHLREGHLRDKRILMLARSVHWFNPLVWWMTRRAEQDLELCCDYALTRNWDKEDRRTYGHVILDQMTAGGRDGSSLTTGFSGSKKEVFRRFRAIMDRSPKGRGWAVIALLICVVLLSQGLVSCQRAEAAPDTPDSPVNVPDSPDTPDSSANPPAPPGGGMDSQSLELYTLLNDYYRNHYPDGIWYWTADTPDQPKEGDYQLGPVTYLGSGYAGTQLGSVYTVGIRHYREEYGWMDGEPATFVLTHGEDGTPAAVHAAIPTEGLTVEDIVFRVLHDVAEPELTLYQDGNPYPLALRSRNFVNYTTDYILNTQPRIGIHRDWEPIYGENDYWATLSWDGLSAVCYYGGTEDTYSPDMIDVTRTDLYTPRGIRVGDSRAAVRDAYPELEDITGPNGTASFWGLEDLEGADVLWYNVTGMDYAFDALLFFFEEDTLSRIVLYYTFD